MLCDRYAYNFLHIFLTFFKNVLNVFFFQKWVQMPTCSLYSLSIKCLLYCIRTHTWLVPTPHTQCTKHTRDCLIYNVCRMDVVSISRVFHQASCFALPWRYTGSCFLSSTLPFVISLENKSAL